MPGNARNIREADRLGHRLVKDLGRYISSMIRINVSPGSIASLRSSSAEAASSHPPQFWSENCIFRFPGGLRKSCPNNNQGPGIEARRQETTALKSTRKAKSKMFIGSPIEGFQAIKALNRGLPEGLDGLSDRTEDRI